MKLLLIPLLSLLGFTTSSNKPLTGRSPGREFVIDQFSEGKLSVKAFQAQEYCRVEVPDFEWEVHFRVVSAEIYFTGPGFRGVEKGTLSSNSLKTIKPYMDRCQPGSIVIFDNVKVVGPDNFLRPIAGLTLRLY